MITLTQNEVEHTTRMTGGGKLVRVSTEPAIFVERRLSGVTFLWIQHGGQDAFRCVYLMDKEREALAAELTREI